MISVLFCSRCKDNPASNLLRFLDSIVAHTTPEERAQLEFLLKFDDDDDQRPSDAQLGRYPFTIRMFSWSRGEGRHSLHHAQEYLFAQRDPRSRFVFLSADDFVITRSGFVSEILSVKDEMCILAPTRPPIETYVVVYEREDVLRQWVVSFGEWSPVVSTRLIEVCQNLGWQSNVDSWLMGLSVVLYDLYGVILWQTHEPFYKRFGGWGLGDTPTYNNMELTGLKGPENKYWFELIRRQARNVYLNLENGTELRRVYWRTKPRLFWRKLTAAPLHHLPYRVCRKMVKTLKALLA